MPGAHLELRGTSSSLLCVQSKFQPYTCSLSWLFAFTSVQP